MAKNLLDDLGKKSDDSTVATVEPTVKPKASKRATVSAEPIVAKEDEVDGEPAVVATKSDDTTDDAFAEWTKEQLADALKETRAEAAKRRVELKDTQEQLQKDYEAKIKSIEEKFTPLIDKAKKLEKLEAEQEDKKRTLEDKLSHREQLIAQRDEELKALREEIQKSKVDSENRIEQLKANLEAHESFYKDQLEKEKSEIPKKFQDIVETMVKGANDSKHALELIRAAKRENLFGEKKVVVNHSVPGAKTGARTDSAAVQQDKRQSLKSSEKIREGLKSAIPQMMEKKRTFGL